MTRKLRVFLCHASQDKPTVSELYKQLAAESWIEPWLDEENLLPGQDFDLEIYKAARDADAMIICLSKISVTKEGYVNKEIRRALDVADEKPEGAIYIIPLRLDDFSPSFERLKKLHYADYFTPNAHEKLLKSLHARANELKLFPANVSRTAEYEPELPREFVPPNFSGIDFDLYRLIKIPVTTGFPYSFLIGKYPVTNSQYERFLRASDFAEKSYWVNFPKYNEDHVLIGKWRTEGWDWLQERLNEDGGLPNPGEWNSEIFGISNPDNPVVGITWYEANAYCNWLLHHWNELTERYVNPSLQPRIIRLPLVSEWITASGGETPAGRYPWDKLGIVTKNKNEIARLANVVESNIEHTTPVNAYQSGASPYGVTDMTGNVWEWQANFYDNERNTIALCGGSWLHYERYAGVVDRSHDNPQAWSSSSGFRVVLIPSV